MPTFQYTPPDTSRAASSIAQTMGLPGQIEAQKAVAIANAQAEAARASGQAWNGAVQNIGQSVAGAVQQATDPRRQLEQAQLADLQRQKAARGVLAQAIKQYTTADPETGGLKTNHEAIAQAVSAAGFPDQAESWLKMSASNAESLDKLKTTTQQHQRQQIEAIGDLAFHAKTPDDFTSAVGLAAQHGLVDEKTAHGILDQASTAPDAWQAMRAKYLPFSPEYKKQQDELNKPMKVGKDESIVIPGTRDILASGPKSAPTGPEMDARAQSLYAKQSKGETLTPDEQAELAGYQQRKDAGETVTVRTMVDGKPVDRVMTKADALKIGTFPSQPAASVVIHNQDLAAAQNPDNPVAKAIAEYKTAPPSPRSLTSPTGQALMKEVMALNPSYDATQFPTRQKMRIAFTSGPQSQTINSLNTAISHLDQFTNVIEALGNGNFQPGNAAFNWVKTTFGDSAPTNFNGIRDIMSGELAAAFKKSGATDDEIRSVKSAISQKNSTKQLLDYVKTIAMPALGSKVVNFDQQYRQVMGKDDPFQILLPESQAILKQHGIDPAHPQMGGGGGTAPKAPAGWKYVAKPGGGWTAVEDK